MSFDDAFGRAYRETVKGRPVPDDLAKRVIGLAREDGQPPRTPQPARRTAAAAPFSRPSLGRKLAPVAACAAIAAVLVIALPVTLSSQAGEDAPLAHEQHTEGPSETSSSHREQAALLPGLSLKAYAADGSQLTPPQPDGRQDSWGDPVIAAGESPLALFYPGGASGTGADTLWPEEDGTITSANFLPETFTVEGSNIQRVQISVSEGELYLQTIDEDVHGPLKVGLEGLDPRRRGARIGYEDCDALAFYDRVEQDGDGRPRTCEDVFRMKRMGPVIDLSKDADARVGTRDIQFGLLSLATSADMKTIGQMSDNHFVETLPKPENPFNGVVLTITATFDDGTCETQVIELRREWAATKDDEIVCAPPLRQYDDRLLETFGIGPICTEIAYGTLLAKTTDPFPCAGEIANQYTGIVMPPMPAYSQPYSID